MVSATKIFNQERYGREVYKILYGKYESKGRQMIRNQIVEIGFIVKHSTEDRRSNDWLLWTL
jgi:hypothetical protein